MWDDTVRFISLCCKGDVSELEEHVDVKTIIMEKAKLLMSLEKEYIHKFVEKETKEKISDMSIVRIIFDFAEPEDGQCSLDLYLNPGQVFGGFNIHLRLHGDEPRIEMCGLS